MTLYNGTNHVQKTGTKTVCYFLALLCIYRQPHNWIFSSSINISGIKGIVGAVSAVAN